MDFDYSTKKTRIGVFFGGKSIENEASFNSGRTICDHLDSFVYDVIPIYQTKKGLLYILPWKFLYRGKTLDFEEKLSSQATAIDWDDLSLYIDFAYIAMHGKFGEDGILQGVLTLLNIPFLGSDIFSSALGMNKAAHNFLLKSYGISIPKGIVIQVNDLQERASLSSLIHKKLQNHQVQLPVVVKPSSEGSSLGVSIVSTIDQLEPAVIKAATINSQMVQPVIIEQKISGMEFTCILLEDRTKVKKESSGWIPLSITEIVLDEESDFYDYRQKYMPGLAQKITPARCSPDIKKKVYDLCIKATEALGFRTLSRIDGFITKDKDVFIIDSNSLSGMSPSTFLFHQAAEKNIGHTELISFLIQNHLDIKKNISTKHRKKIMNKQKILVLMGGSSNEKEISLESGRNVCYKLSSEKYEIIPVFIDDKQQLFRLTHRLLVQNSCAEIASQVNTKQQLKWIDIPKIGDFVFIALHGGFGENGAVQGMLEMLDMPYNGSGVFASSLCMNKYKTSQWLGLSGIDVPSSVLITRQEWSKLEKNESNFATFLRGVSRPLSFPFVVKPHNDGCSTLVSFVNDFSSLKKTVSTFFDTLKNNAFMIEEYVQGTELTVGVLGNSTIQVLPASAPVSQKHVLSIEEKFLPGAGENQTPAMLEISAQKLVQEVVEKAYIAAQCQGYARIDCFYQNASQSPTGKQRVVILEINTLPGLTPATCLFHQAAEIGVNPMSLLTKIIDLGVEVHKGGLLEPIDSCSVSYNSLARQAKALRSNVSNETSS